MIVALYYLEEGNLISHQNILGMKTGINEGWEIFFNLIGLVCAKLNQLVLFSNELK